MIQQIKPDYYITVGIKGEDVISVSWGSKFAYKFIDNKGCVKAVKKYLKKALKMVEKTK